MLRGYISHEAQKWHLSGYPFQQCFISCLVAEAGPFAMQSCKSLIPTGDLGHNSHAAKHGKHATRRTGMHVVHTSSSLCFDVHSVQGCVVKCLLASFVFLHVWRLQVHRQFRKPLIVMSPKALLRHPKCKSLLTEFDDHPDDHGERACCSTLPRNAKVSGRASSAVAAASDSQCVCSHGCRASAALNVCNL